MLIKKGDKFNRLTAIKFSYRDKNSFQYWLFKCDCGNEKVIRVYRVKIGTTKSCGCYGKEIIIKHGMFGTRVYYSWAGMKSRCLNKNNPAYKNYGGRGITVCPEWMDFKNFYADMGEMPENKSLDRIKNNLGYCKGNCRYATRIEQQNNTRKNVFITYKCKTQTISQWSRELNINDGTLRDRINRYNWSVEKALGKR